jgi:hypothetical protein
MIETNEITLQSISTKASMRKARWGQSHSAQSSGVWVPATTDSSLLNNGRSRQASSVGEEPLLENATHLGNLLGIAESSGSSTSDSNNCLPANELPSTSHPPVYSEAVNDGGIDEDNSGSISGSNNMAPEEVEAVYNLWRQLPEEQCPWASTASLLDKLRARGLIARQNPQH